MGQEMEKVVLVTGATGFVGANLVSLLTSAGYNPIPFLHPEIPLEKLASLNSQHSILAIVHCAGKINGSVEQIQTSNEKLTAALISKVASVNRALKVIFLSSVSAIDSLGDYGASKRNCEILFEKSSLENWTILRPSLLYGPNDSKNVGTLIKLAKWWPVIPVPGKSVVKLQPLYICDFFSVIKHLIESNSFAKRTYVTSGPQQEFLWDMVKEIQAALNRPVCRIPVPLFLLKSLFKIGSILLPSANLPVQQVSSLHSHPPYDSSDANNELGFTPRIFKEGIREIVRPL